MPRDFLKVVYGGTELFWTQFVLQNHRCFPRTFTYILEETLLRYDGFSSTEQYIERQNIASLDV